MRRAPSCSPASTTSAPSPIIWNSRAFSPRIFAHADVTIFGSDGVSGLPAEQESVALRNRAAHDEVLTRKTRSGQGVGTGDPGTVVEVRLPRTSRKGSEDTSSNLDCLNPSGKSGGAVAYRRMPDAFTTRSIRDRRVLSYLQSRRRSRSIFRTDADYLEFIGRLKRNAERYRIGVIAYCLIPNHFHFLLRQEDEVAVGAMIQYTCNGYAQWFNRRYQRVGTLFQGRFRAIHVIRTTICAICVDTFMGTRFGMASHCSRRCGNTPTTWIGSGGAGSSWSTTSSSSIILSRLNHIEAT